MTPRLPSAAPPSPLYGLSLASDDEAGDEEHLLGLSLDHQVDVLRSIPEDAHDHEAGDPVPEVACLDEDLLHVLEAEQQHLQDSLRQPGMDMLHDEAFDSPPMSPQLENVIEEEEDE
jgi:hypothetical protein